MEISRRQLLGGSIGLASAGLLGACGSSSTGFSLLQSTEGTRVTTGRTISAQYSKNVSAGSLLVAVVTRKSTSVLAPTIGQVSDDQGNHWLQAVEFFSDHFYGLDIWYCESAGGGNRPLVQGIGLGYPVLPGITGMNMALFEYTGATGFELCDQICQARISESAAKTTSNFSLASDHELAISVIMGEMSSATAPEGWNLRLSDTTQRCYIADNLDTGSSSSGSRLSARWTNLKGAHGGVGIMATFVPKGVPAGSRRLVQSCYTDSAILPTGMGHPTWTSQSYPVNPKPGNTLVAFMNGSIYNPSIDCGSVVSVIDSAGGTWRQLGQSGPDDHTGINISCWMCQSAVGGPTDLSATFSNASQQLACLLLEFANFPHHLEVANLERRTFGSDLPHLTSQSPISAGDIALAFRTSIFVLPEGPGPDWKQIMSDTTGANALMMLNTPAGPLSAVWSGSIVRGGLDILMVALTSGR